MRIIIAAALAAISLPAISTAGAAGDNPQRERVRAREAALIEQARQRGVEIEPMRIIGGQVAGKGEWPWQVALLLSGIADERSAQFCGGTLVRRNWVVTAAHCVEGMSANQLHVLTETNRLDGSGVRRGVAKIIVHAKFDFNALQNDIALVKLGTSVPGDVPLAELITGGEENKRAAPGDNVFVTGWGSTIRSGGNVPLELREAKVPVVANDVCDKAKVYEGAITARMICAGELDGSRGPCVGDSGGPLLARDGSGDWRLLAGIVSFGTVPCALKKHPGVFTRVSAFRGWILDRIKD